MRDKSGRKLCVDCESRSKGSLVSTSSSSPVKIVPVKESSGMLSKASSGLEDPKLNVSAYARALMVLEDKFCTAVLLLDQRLVTQSNMQARTCYNLCHSLTLTFPQ